MTDPFNLLSAIEEGNCSHVLNLLENRAINIEQRDQNGQTPLITAAEKGNIPIVHEILKRNPDVDAQDDDGWTALIAACKEGHVDVVKELLDHGARIQVSDLGGWTPLVWASYKGHRDIVTELLARGADPNEKGQHGMTALIWASGRGHIECVKELLDAGALADSADKYGTTALVWAARKGHLEVVKALVEKGANINIAGTRGWTALIMASKGGYTDLVEYLLHRDPNVNATDQEGYSSLAWSAKQGHDEIVKKLIAKGAYYNLTDKDGETVLISASRDGHLEVVKTLLSKFAEVDAVDSEGKSALFHAVEQGHTAIVKELLDAGAKTEITNRDGDTPLIRATVKKHTEIVALLLEKGALVSSADRRGDTAVHIAVRGRFRRICELLLRNPKDARLLYRPNKAGETPYNIDRQHRTSILTQIFGTGLFVGGKKCSEEVMGYDVYTSALADVLCEPSLSMPLTVGMYARWGSGKSFVLKRLQEEMREFAHQDMRPVFQFSRFIFLIVLVVSIIFGVIMWAALGIVEGICIGLALFISAYSLFLCAYVADRRYTNGETPCAIGGYVANSVSTIKLLLQFIFCIPPSPRAMKPSLPVRFFFTDFSKLTCSGSEAASLVGMIETLCDVVESEFGFFVSRLYRVFRTPHSEYDDTDYIEARWKRCCCCIPTFIIFLFVIICGLTSLTLFTVNGTKGGSVITGIEIATAAVVGVAVLAHFPTLCSMLYSLAFSQKKRISVVATQLGLKEEGFIHALKQEVELLTDLVNCVDGFTRHQTRIVIVIDGLDNSEQSKVLQLLDSVNLLFTDPEAPFIILMALDPRVIIRAIDQSFSSILRESHISASDYLKSIVQLPFYLPEPKSNYTGVLSPNVMSLLDDVRNVDYDSDHHTDANLRPSSIVHDDMEWDGEMLQYDNDKRAHRDFHNCNGGVPGRMHPDLNLDSSMIYEPNERDPCLAVDHQKMLEKELELEERRKISADLAQVLADNETVNPLGVKRLMNIVSLTCRLLRARSVEYSWKRLAAWVSLVDGWPYKTSWLVLLIEDSNTHIRDNVCLKDLYEATLSAMPVINEVDCMVDGDPVYFETFLSSHQPLLRAADVRRFLMSTVHLDQSLRRQMVECLHAGLASGSNAKSETESVGKRSSAYQLTATYNAKDKQINLNSLTIDDVCKQLSELEGLDQKQMSTYQKVVTDNNINGKVLATCDLSELSQIMGMTFGDWQLFRAWIINARYPQECGTCNPGSRCISPGTWSNFSDQKKFENFFKMPISCRFYKRIYPEVDDVVMVNVRSIAEMGAYVNLLEYNNIEGMILLSELSRRRIRSINKLIRVGRNECVVVIRVDKDKGYIDLSKRRVSPEEVKKCEEKFTKAKTVYSILRHCAEILGYESDEQLEDLYEKTAWYFDQKYKTPGSSYDAFKLAVADPTVLDELNLDEKTKETLLANIKRRLTPQAVKIRADLEVTCYGYEGIDAVKQALRMGLECSTEEIPIKVNLIAAPLYVITTTTLDHEEGLKSLVQAVDAIKTSIKQSGGEFTEKAAPKVVTETDEIELAKQMERLEKENAEVDGDDDNPDDEEIMDDM